MNVKAVRGSSPCGRIHNKNTATPPSCSILLFVVYTTDLILIISIF